MFNLCELSVMHMAWVCACVHLYVHSRMFQVYKLHKTVYDYKVLWDGNPNYNPRKFLVVKLQPDRLCVLVVRVPGYRSRGPGFDSRCYQIFWEIVDLEQGPLSLVSVIEELLGRNSNGPGL
jgi:hypothetical protein